MRQPSHSPYTPTPTPLAVACNKALGFSFVELLLGLGVATLLGVGTFTVAKNLEQKKNLRTEQSNVEQIASRVGGAYSSLGRFPSDLREAAIGDRLVPPNMVQGTTLRSSWGSAVDLATTTIDGKADAGMEIIYASVPKSGCAPLALAAGGGMFDVQIEGSTVLDAEGNVDPLLAAERCDIAAGAEVVFTYYSGASGLAVTTPPPLCSADPSNPLCAEPPPPGAPPVAPPGAPPVSPPPPPPPPPPPGSPPPPVVTPPPPSSPPVTPPPPPSVPPPSSPPPFCTIPIEPPQDRSWNCAPGTVLTDGSTTFTQSRSRTYSCPDPWDSAVASPWSAWAPLESTMCAPLCVAPPTLNEPITRNLSPEAQSIACPSPQTGLISQERTRSESGTRTTTYTCPAPTGTFDTNPATDSWSGSITYGGWVETSRTCVTPPPPPPACGPAPAPGIRTLACAADQTGSITQSHGWDSQPAPTCWISQGWLTTSNTCTPIPPPPPSCSPPVGTPGAATITKFILCMGTYDVASLVTAAYPPGVYPPAGVQMAARYSCETASQTYYIQRPSALNGMSESTYYFMRVQMLYEGVTTEMTFRGESLPTTNGSNFAGGIYQNPGVPQFIPSSTPGGSGETASGGIPRGVSMNFRGQRTSYDNAYLVINQGSVACN